MPRALCTLAAALVLLAALAAGACTAGATPAATPAEDTTATQASTDYPLVDALAPIERLSLNVGESDPLQYFVAVTSGVPNGCTRFDRIEVSREDTTIRVDVINRAPAPDARVACTQVYGLAENSVPLGSDFEAGVEYTVEVNDQVLLFVAR